jgi:hypothetical protein
VINLGHGQAKVADLARLVTQRLGLVDAAQELGDDQCDAKSYRAKARAKGRRAHAVDLAPACIRRSLWYSSAAHNRVELTDGKLSVRFGRPKAVDQGVDETVHELKVLIGTGVEGCAQRIEYACLRTRALDYRIHQCRLERRLGEHARRIELFESLMDLAKALRARSHCGVDGDHADRFHSVAVLEILIGIVEHDVRTIGNGS